MKIKNSIIVILIMIILINVMSIHIQVLADDNEEIILINSLKSEDPISKSFSIAVNQSRTIAISVSPPNANNKKLLWKSSNNKIATVNSSGKVKGIKVGTCTITVQTTDGSNKSLKYTVNVKKRKTRYKFYY